MLRWYYIYYIAVAYAMSESIRTVWDWEIGGDRYYYEMPPSTPSTPSVTRLNKSKEM